VRMATDGIRRDDRRRRPRADRFAEGDAEERPPEESSAAEWELDLPFDVAGEEDASPLAEPLRRLALDLHDGPLQEVAALLADARCFRARVETEPTATAHARLEGFIDDVEARLLHLDASLRALIRGDERPLSGGLDHALHEVTREFESTSGIRVDLRLEGRLRDLSPPQALALVRVVQAALANVRLHARARSVEVVVRRLAARVEAEVVDDGVGLDVSDALMRVILDGRLGLAGMAERVRRLGGEIHVESGAGGRGTRIAAWLPLAPIRGRRS
jgi:signal transduction histidine kinase